MVLFSSVTDDGQGRFFFTGELVDNYWLVMVNNVNSGYENMKMVQQLASGKDTKNMENHHL